MSIAQYHAPDYFGTYHVLKTKHLAFMVRIIRQHLPTKDNRLMFLKIWGLQNTKYMAACGSNIFQSSKSSCYVDIYRNVVAFLPLKRVTFKGFYNIW